MIEPNLSDSDIQDRLKRSGPIPAHVAVIMDGNGRWAKKRGLPRVAGHREGIRSVRDIVEASSQIGIRVLTLYTFSTENWKRPRNEVSALMGLLIRTIKKEVDDLIKNNVRLTAIGSLDRLPDEARRNFLNAIERTKSNSGLILNLALSYGSREEILRAVRKIASDVRSGKINPDEIVKETLESRLDTAGLPDPDLLIRTSGEFRISNFLLWQLAYTEIHVTDVFWPDFRRLNLYHAIDDFQRRERRFGKVSEQLKTSPGKSGA
jgi:undecaprenyl diphosphate synthase